VTHVSASDWLLVKAAHSRAVEMSRAEGEAFLQQELGHRPELLQEAKKLLGWHWEAGDFLRTPLAHRWSPVVGNLETTRIGPYELIRELGRGGSATVYLARRADDLFERQVAIKVMSRLAHSVDAFRRFQREIQILARVEHPYIVRLLEAGTTGEALAYIVTEFVDGRPIDEFVAALGVEEKVRLFVKVCEAVSAAHQSLIVHRDLKPRNILVTAAGLPKVLDFGIAVLLDRESDLTNTGMERFTLHYASPEQLRGERRFTTAWDVYSLGALLYKLLAGRPPFEYAEHEMAARIARESPPALSGVPRDLEAIVRKALDRDPSRRYESVDRLHDDLTRFLHRLPVEARGQSGAYRLRKYARKHWALVVAPALVIALLSLFWSLSERSLRIARRESQVVRELLFQSLPRVIGEAPYLTELRVRMRVESARLPFLDSLAAEYPEDRDIGRARFAAWRVVGTVAGLPDSMNLGETRKAFDHLRQAALFGEGMAAHWKDDRELRRDVAITHIELGTVLLEMNRPDEAQKEFARAEALGGDRVDLEAMAQKSRIMVLRGERQEALSARLWIVGERRRLFEKNPEEIDWEFAGALCSLGELEREMARYSDAEAAYAEALPIIERRAAAPRSLDDVWNAARENEEYGRVLIMLKKRQKARAHLARAVSLYRELRSADAAAMSNQRALAMCLAVLGAEMEQAGNRLQGEEMIAEAERLSGEAASHDPASTKAQAELASIRVMRARPVR